MKEKKSVLYITNIPSPYSVNFLNELGKLCNLTAIFERYDSSERDKSWKEFRFETFKGIILKGWKVGADASIDFQIVKYLNRRYDAIIVSNPCTPTGMIAITYMKLMRIKYGIASEGGMAKNGLGVKEKIKKFLFSNAEVYFSTGWKGDEYFVTYGANQDKIKWFPYTTLYREDILPHTLSVNEKEKYKISVGCQNKRMILSIGRFIPGKGMDVLMKAFQKIEGDIELVIVGGTPPEEYILLQKQLNIHNIRFVDFSNKEGLINYYKAADIFVLPTRSDTWGLVIPEAMSFGLPVISTDQCVAALSLIRNDKNGYIVPVENVNELKSKICAILENDNLSNLMAEENLKSMQDYSVEKMAQCVFYGLKLLDNE